MKGLRDIDVMSLGQKRLMGARLFQVRFAAFLGKDAVATVALLIALVEYIHTIIF